MAIHPAYARLLYAYLQGRGVDAAAVFACAGVQWKELATEQRFFSYEEACCVIAGAQRSLDCPGLGFALGSMTQVSMHGVVGHAAVTSTNLRNTLDVVARYSGLRNAAFRYYLVPTPDGATLQVHEQFDLGSSRLFFVEGLFATLMVVIETAVGSDLSSMTVELPFPEPAWSGDYQRFELRHLYFDAPRLAFRLPDDLLIRPNLTADIYANELAKLECDRILASSATQSLVRRVREHLHACDGDYPSLERLADNWNSSSRQLIRKLKQENSSYQSVLDEVRKGRALWYLRQTEQTVEQIAAHLGYSDTSNFSRSFRRWFGLTPRDVRKGFNRDYFQQ